MRRLSRFIGRAAFLAALVLLTNALLPLRRHAVGEPRQETAAFHHEDGPGVADDVDQDSPLNPTCNCRHLSNRTFESFGHRSTCGILGDARGPHQKVVSFVVFGQGITNFLSGAEKNLEGMRSLYPPGFIMRLYHETSEHSKDREELCEIFCRNDDLDICHVGYDVGLSGDIRDTFGMIWRFAPMADPLVDEWHSRDLDSVISDREAAAVNDWRSNSTAHYHVMRDHKYHGVAVMGGMFGMRLDDVNAATLKEVFANMVKSSPRRRSGKGYDQTLLSKYLWPVMQGDVVQHDSYSCEEYRNSGFMRPFPTKRRSNDDFTRGETNNFVGSNGGTLDLRNHEPCPANCRPKEHRDWMLC